MDRIFCHFGPFFVLLPPPLTTPKIKILKKWKKIHGYINDNHMIYGSWDMECKDKVFCHFGPILPFYSLTTQKIKILKMKKTPGDIIIFHTCTINENHMMYGVWFLRYGVQKTEFFVILDCFLPFYPPKSKFWKNEKSAWRYHFTLVYQKSWPYATLFLRYDVWWMQFSFFILGYFSPF